MRVHIVVDYSFLYYKYKFQLESGKIRRLTAPVEINGVVIEKDVSQIYYSIKEIEGFRRNLESAGHNVVVSICFDMPSLRKEMIDNKIVGEYKSNRVAKLSLDDINNIEIVESLLKCAGHNTYRVVGYEADDLVYNVVKNYRDNFDYTIIYTPDADLMVNIDNKVGMMRYKSTKGYEMVDINNYESYLSAEMKCRVPYNAIMLFKCTCGDKSDNISGIKKFGPKAFDKLVGYLDSKGVNWSEYGDYNKTLELLELSRGYLTDEQIQEAIESLSLIKPMIIEKESLKEPTEVSTPEKRKEAYLKYNMQSLIY